MSPNKIWYLSQIDFLSAMGKDKMVEEMDRITDMESVPKSEPIYLPGDPAESIFLLKTGRVRISKLSEEGKQITLQILEPGNIFGELSIIEEDSSHETIAEAMADTILCQIHREDFESFLKRNPEINLKVTKLIGLRLRRIESKVEDLVFKSAEDRLFDLLRRLSLDYPKKVADGVMLNIKLTHQELGELTNIARQTVTELLKRLEKQGKIKVEKRRITILKNAV